jgi:alpha-ketoglutarate-dependent taurine dioxygenase
MKVEPLDATLGAVVTGVRLADLDDPTWTAIEDAFHQHAVLVFPAQHLSGAEQKAFARRFGALEEQLGPEGTVAITNATKDGHVLEPGHPVLDILRGNEGWHTDSSYMPVSARASMLSAQVVPTEGGTTEWADMRAAFDALDDETRSLVVTLAAHHSLLWSQRRIGAEPEVGSFYGYVEDEPLRPLVKAHPATGRPSLFIGRHAHAIPGMTEEASIELLDRLLDVACRPPRRYEHHWTVGDLVVWDNRCVLHRGHPWPSDQRRLLRHTRVSGDPVTEAALAVERCGPARD